MLRSIHFYSDEEKQFIADKVKGTSYKEMARLFNKKFNTSISDKAIGATIKRLGLSNGINACFPKGNIPANKGTKGMFNVGGNKTSFKKGQTPINCRPIGSERIDSKDGYILVKVTEKKWIPKHRKVWEEINGPIPKGYIVIFLDGDKLNCSIENLKMISKSQNARLNQNGWRFDNPEATEIGILLADLKIKANKKADSGKSTNK